jgi:hypothetical protein
MLAVQVRVRDQTADDFEVVTDVEERRWVVALVVTTLARTRMRTSLDWLALAALVKRGVIDKQVQILLTVKARRWTLSPLMRSARRVRVVRPEQKQHV